jgi:hypothetical protein
MRGVLAPAHSRALCIKLPCTSKRRFPCLPTACPLPAHRLPTACPLPAHCLPTACPLPAHCLPTACPLPAHCLQAALAQHLSSSQQAQQAQVYALLQELLARHNSDDFLYTYLVLINQYVTEVGGMAMQPLELSSCWVAVE